MIFIFSRNQLTALPREICRLPLQTLLVAYNRLASLPEELGRMSALAELDVGCNEVTSLPPRIGDLPRLRILDLRNNLLVQMPIGKFYYYFCFLLFMKCKIFRQIFAYTTIRSDIEKLYDSKLYTPLIIFFKM